MQLNRQEKLLTGFIGYSLVSIFMTIVCFTFFQKTEQIDDLVSKTQLLSETMLEAVNASDDFLIFESDYQEFYRSGNSVYLAEYAELKTESKVSFEKIHSQKSFMEFGMDKEIHQIYNAFSDYDTVFMELTRQMRKIGYLTFGIEGKLQKAAAALEKNKAIDQSLLLQLRLQEKNYTIREDMRYANLHEHYFMQMQHFVDGNKQLSAAEKESSRKEIKEYGIVFKEYQSCKEGMGLKNNKGLRFKLREKANTITSKIKGFAVLAERHKDDLNFKTRVLYAGMIVLSVLIALALSVFFQIAASALQNDRAMNYER